MAMTEHESGTTATNANQSANTVLAGPTSGGAAVPAYRALVAADIPALSGLNGTVAISQGGTGQTSQTAAFDALAPTTTQGDIIYHNGTDNVRLAKGTALQGLRMNADATAPEWASDGLWTTPAFSAGNFTANGTMTWTVASGDVVTYEYTLVGKAMFVNFYIENTTVGGSVNTQLRIAVPGGYAIAKSAIDSCIVNDNGGGSTTGLVLASASTTFIAVQKIPAGNWTLATDATSVYGQINFEVQ